MLTCTTTFNFANKVFSRQNWITISAHCRFSLSCGKFMFTLVYNLVKKLIELFYLKFDYLGVSAYSDSFWKCSRKFGFFCGNIDA